MSEDKSILDSIQFLDSNQYSFWSINYKCNKIPAAVVMKDSLFMKTKRKEAYQLGYDNFNTPSHAEICRELVSIIGINKCMLCEHTSESIDYNRRLRSISQEVFEYAKENPESYSPQIPTYRLDLNYLGDKDIQSVEKNTITNETYSVADKVDDNIKQIDLLNYALDKYWVPMLKLLEKLSSEWCLAGRRHATLQRLRAIQEIAREVADINGYFEKTLQWILDVLGSFTKPLTLKYYSMENLVRHVVNAITTGRIVKEGDCEKSVVLCQYEQMNNIIMLWMEKTISRSCLKRMMRETFRKNKV